MIHYCMIIVIVKLRFFFEFVNKVISLLLIIIIIIIINIIINLFFISNIFLQYWTLLVSYSYIS